MKVIKPRKLRIGDKVRVIAPSSPFDRGDFLKGLGVLASMGLNISFRKDIVEKKYYLAGSESRRLDELHEAFEDGDCKAIFCARGGFGATRLLSKIDWALLKKNPKIFAGYSDITSLGLSMYSMCAMTTFHSPMITSKTFTSMDLRKKTFFRKAFFSTAPIIYKNVPGLTVIARGKARARLLGGNLTLIHSLLGTRYMPDFNGKILFFEDTDEAPYRIDRILTHLFEVGLFSGVKGVVVGKFTAKGRPLGRRDQGLIKGLVTEYFMPLGVPVVMNFPSGHGKRNLILPLGSLALLDTGSKRLISEAGVRG